MGKKDKEAEANQAPALPYSKIGNKIVLDDPDSPGTQISRVDFCRREFGLKGRERGEIAKQLGVVYQIVFGATKGMTKGTPYVAKAAEAQGAAAGSNA